MMILDNLFDPGFAGGFPLQRADSIPQLQVAAAYLTLLRLAKRFLIPTLNDVSILSAKQHAAIYGFPSM